MSDLIERSAIKYHEQLESFGNGMYKPVKVAYMNDIDALPAVDAVPVGAYKQVRWERDTAIEQLRQLGYELGEKIREDAVPVAHGRWKIGDRTNVYGGREIICSQCGESFMVSPKTLEYLSDCERFCCRCGARMDGKDEE